LSFSFNNGNDILFYKLYLHFFNGILSALKSTLVVLSPVVFVAVRFLLTALQLYY